MEAPIPDMLAKIENAIRWCRIYQNRGEDIMASSYWDDVRVMVLQHGLEQDWKAEQPYSAPTVGQANGQ